MKVLRIVGAGVVGFLLGSMVNMFFITVGMDVIPVPEGVDPNDVDSIAAGIHLYGPEHFIFPFLAHALGAFTGALMAYLLTAEHKERLAWILGSLNLLGGITAATLIPAPAWYIAVDLVFAYLPMAYLAILVGRRVQKPSAQEER